MTKPNSRIVQRHDDGGWEVRKPGASRASAVEATQAEAIQRARDILKNDGGGELKVRSEKETSGSKIRSIQETTHDLRRDSP